MLTKEININKKFILVFVLINIIALGLYYSYALFQTNIIKDNVIVINTGTIDLSVTLDDSNSNNIPNNTFSLSANETKTITVNLSTTNTGEIGYKLYYLAEGNPNLTIMASKSFTGNVVASTMTDSDTFDLIFKNNGSSSVSITIGGHGGLPTYPINLNNGEHEIQTTVTAANVSYTPPEGVTCDDGDGHCTFQVMIDQMASMLD